MINMRDRSAIGSSSIPVDPSCAPHGPSHPCAPSPTWASSRTSWPPPPEEVRPIALALRALIAELHPNATEVPRKGERTLAYGYGEKKMSEAYAYLMPQKSYVNLVFFHGASLTHLHPALEGTGARLRHIKVRSLEVAASAEIRHVLLDAMAERRAALGLDNL